MKKNKILRLASVMLMLCLITTCAISGTFAKYTTSGSANETARVAKWGFDTLTLKLDMFKDAYGATVKSAGSDDVIAPGTEGSYTIDLQPTSGAPEVSYNFTITLEKDASTNEALFNKIEWSIDGTTYGTFADLNAKIAAAYADTYAPGDTPDDLTIYWRWTFYVDDAGDTSDTTLGNGTASLKINASFTATQVTD